MRFLVSLPLIAALMLAGCTTRKPDLGKLENEKKKGHEHGDGPNKGVVTDWGEDGKYHVEFCVDHPTQQATVYILDGAAEKAEAIKVESITLKINSPAFEVVLKAKPQEGDPEGTSSRFVGVHAALGKEQEFAGKIIGKVDGKERIGEFQEEPAKK